MTDSQSPDIEAIQAVVDRISSYQDGAPDSTVEYELRKALDEAGLDVAPQHLDALARAIEQHGGQVSAAEVLGR